MFKEIVKSYVRESLSSLMPCHFWALSTTSLTLTCVNSHLVTYIPLPLTTSRHRKFLIGEGYRYWISTQCTLHCDHVYYLHSASTSILSIFMMLYACRSLSLHILLSNDPNENPASQTAPGHVLMYVSDIN